jgi:hypothetical protein
MSGSKAARELAVNTTVGGDTFPAGTKVGDVVNGVKFTAEIAKSVTNPKAWGGDVPAEDDATDTKSEAAAESPWAKVAKKDLLAEVEKRNAEREDDAKIAPASDKVDDLRAALDADDAAAADGDGDDDGDVTE